MSTDRRPFREPGKGRTGATATTGGRGADAAHRAASSPQGAAVDLEEVRRSEEFEALRRSFRRVVFPTTAAFLAWYALYVLLAAYAPAFMGTRVGGSTITIGLLLGFGQFVTTFAITMAYRRWADRRFDARAEVLRDRITRGAAR